MNPQRIFCGICGYGTDAALFEHIRETHGLKPADYKKQCPNAPLFTAAFREYVRQQGAHVDTPTDETPIEEGGEIRVTRELFGVKVSCAATPQPLVPAVDEAYHFEPGQAQAVLQSLLDGDRMLLVGPTGAGKSSLVMQLAARVNWPMVRVVCPIYTNRPFVHLTHYISAGYAISLFSSQSSYSHIVGYGGLEGQEVDSFLAKGLCMRLV